MYIYKPAQADYLNIHFLYHCSIPAGFLPNSRDAVKNGCGIPYSSSKKCSIQLITIIIGDARFLKIIHDMLSVSAA